MGTFEELQWRRLGRLLVDEGLVEQADLEYALAVQRESGGLLGEILVTCGFVDSQQISAALARQESTRVVSAGEFRRRRLRVPPATARDGARAGSKPLGRLLVERGLLTESGLERALVDQLQTGRLLGEIVVSRGWVSREDLMRTIAEQQGEVVADLDADPDGSAASDDATFEVCAGNVTLEAGSEFLEAADLAFELIEREDPASVQILRISGERREQVWSYTRPADAPADSWGPGWPLARHGGQAAG